MKFINQNNLKATQIFEPSNTIRIASAKAVILSENKIFITYGIKSTTITTSTTYDLHAMVCTIEGTTIKAGIDTVLSTVYNSGEDISVVALSENKVFIIHSYGDGYSLRGMVCTIEETTITKGTDKSLISQMYAGKNAFVSVLSENKVIITYSYDTTYDLCAMVCTIEGTTITAGKNTLLNSDEYSGYSSMSSYLAYSPLIALSENKVFIAHSAIKSSLYLYGMVCTIEGTTITAGTDTRLSSEQSSGIQPSVVALSENKVFITYLVSTYLHVMVCIIEGTTITAGTNTKLTSQMTSFMVPTIFSDNKSLIIYSLGNVISGLNTLTLYTCICVINNTLITMETNRLLISSSGKGRTLLAFRVSNTNFSIIYLDTATQVIKGIIDADLKDLVIQLQKSSDTIKGIAKTKGNEGQMVQIYVPSI